MPSKHGLGKGLDALIPSSEERTEVAIEKIKAGAAQPRQLFPEKPLMELAYSIKLHGIVQPLVVAPKDGHYELIAGERRLRAAKLAGLRNVPVVIRTVDEQQRYELALVENLQRSNLSPLDEAKAFQKLLADFNLTQDELAKRLGKSRSKIANSLRLLGLSQTMAASLERGDITPGHANALLALDGTDRERLFTLITTKGWSVRQAERWRASAPSKRPAAKPSWLQEIERELGTEVLQRGTNRRGSLTIRYHSFEELEGLLNRLKGGSTTSGKGRRNSGA